MCAKKPLMQRLLVGRAAGSRLPGAGLSLVVVPLALVEYPGLLGYHNKGKRFAAGGFSDKVRHVLLALDADLAALFFAINRQYFELEQIYHASEVAAELGKGFFLTIARAHIAVGFFVLFVDKGVHLFADPFFDLLLNGQG